MSLKRSLLKVVAGCLSGEHNKLVAATHNPRKEQERVLSKIIARNQNSSFGKAFQFGQINSISDFQDKIPITDYDFLFPWIEKEMRGEGRQLTESKVESFVTTSGTTSVCKFIPITKEYIKAYKDGIGIWVANAFREHPEIAGKVFTVASARVEGYTEAGTPYGAVSGLMHDSQGFWGRIHLAVKDSRVFSIKDYKNKYYALARVALAEDLTHMQTANPLTMVNLCRMIEDNSEKLIKDIYDGKISAEASVDVKQDKTRARELEKILSEGKFTPKEFWPNMALVGCWTGGTQYLFLEQLKKKFGDVPFRDIGLLASEGRMTIPTRDNTSSGVLDITHSFFEFIPEQEMGQKKPAVLTAEQIQKGQNYFILLTTGSGLYRYNIFDMVECTGFMNKTPEVAFLNKGNYISNISGEKLTEHQVVEAYRRARTEGMPDEFILYPKADCERVRYVFLSAEETDNSFAEKMDLALQGANSEYQSRRDGQKLSMLETRKITSNDFERISKARLVPGKEAQFKHKYLRELNLVQ